MLCMCDCKCLIYFSYSSTYSVSWHERLISTLVVDQALLKRYYRVKCEKLERFLTYLPVYLFVGFGFYLYY